MSKIEFRENKVLKLVNVLSRPVPVEDLMNNDKQIIMLQNWIKAKGYQKQGPLIMYSCIKGIEGDEPIIDSKIMVQLQNGNIRLELPYKFEPELRIENCLMARFNDHSDKLQFASQKLTLFAYENDIELTGETYIVFINQTAENLLADVFMPVKQNI